MLWASLTNKSFLHGLSFQLLFASVANNFICEIHVLCQISYGRFFANPKGNSEVDLFIMQADGKKIVDPNKQNAVCARLRMELLHPLRVAVVSRGPDTELLVANPVELSGRGRPLVFYDITLALKILNISIFSVPPLFHFLAKYISAVEDYPTLNDLCDLLFSI